LRDFGSRRLDPVLAAAWEETIQNPDGRAKSFLLPNGTAMV
jgi:hypothetical protein